MLGMSLPSPSLPFLLLAAQGGEQLMWSPQAFLLPSLYWGGWSPHLTSGPSPAPSLKMTVVACLQD